MRTASVTIKQTVILIGVVVVLVFVVTYASTILGTPEGPIKSGQTPPAPDVQLAFASPTTVPVPSPDKGGDPPPTPWEWQAPGHQDFWFRNDRADPVQVALNGVGCAACTKVELCVLPETWKDLKPEDLDARAQDPSLSWQVLDANDTKGLTVPAHAAGGVRLNWEKKERAFGPQTLSADLGTECRKTTGHTIKLQVGLAWVDPVMIGAEDKLKEPPKEGKEGEVAIGTLLAGEAKTVNLLCWSLTRPAFKLQAEKPEDPCVTCDTPEKLSADECKKVGEAIPSPILCAYRVRVTVRERTADGKQLDLGRFRRYVKFTSDAVAEKGSATITGVVQGDIMVGTEKERDLLLLGSFERSVGTTKEIPLTTERAGLALEIESKPEFLTAELREEQGIGALGKTWTLSVTVPPDTTLSGPVPPHSYLVLRTKGDKPRRINIPVIGNAYVK
jgi:hypothetical protein